MVPSLGCREDSYTELFKNISAPLPEIGWGGTSLLLKDPLEVLCSRIGNKVDQKRLGEIENHTHLDSCHITCLRRGQAQNFQIFIHLKVKPEIQIVS